LFSHVLFLQLLAPSPLPRTFTFIVRLVQGSGTLIMTLVVLPPQLAAGQDQSSGGRTKILAAGTATSVGHQGVAEKVAKTWITTGS